MFFFKHSSNVSDSICLPTISLAALAVMIVGLTIKAEVSASSVGPDCKVAPNLQDVNKIRDYVNDCIKAKDGIRFGKRYDQIGDEDRDRDQQQREQLDTLTILNRKRKLNDNHPTQNRPGTTETEAVKHQIPYAKIWLPLVWQSVMAKKSPPRPQPPRAYQFQRGLVLAQSGSRAIGSTN